MIKVLGMIAMSIGVVAAMAVIKMLDLPWLITAALLFALIIFFVINLVKLSDEGKKKSTGSKSPSQK
ncbi:MAG: hypothetical protein NTX36_08155 [Proteobacteria bacterium]|nr:hypothetical protein [Pseudomonadota bacterium]